MFKVKLAGLLVAEKKNQADKFRHKHLQIIRLVREREIAKK